MAASSSLEESMSSVNNGTGSMSISTVVPMVTFLIFFIVAGIFGNMILIIVYSKGKSLKPISSHMFTMNLAAASICDCILNMPFLVVSTFTESWDMGSLACVINAFLMSVVVMEITLGLFIYTIDRLLVVKYGSRYTNFMSVTRASLILCYTWIHVILFNIPILTGKVEIFADEDLYFCLYGDNLSVVYVCFNSVICFFLPLIVMTITYIYLVRASYKESSAFHHKTAQNHDDDDISFKLVEKLDPDSTKCSGSLFCVWLILSVPYLLTYYVRLYQNSIEITSENSAKLRYSWHIDLVLTWMRFGFTLALPIIAFSWRKDLRQQLRDCICCRKSNSVVDIPVPDKQCLDDEVNKCHLEIDSNISGMKPEIKRKTKEKPKEMLGSVVAFQVPVLFATSKGVHLQTYEDDLSESEMNTDRIRGKKCDVHGSQDYLNFIGDQTSDYDSGNELDPFSVSHPVSSKKLRDNNEFQVQNRSVSQPEVRNEIARNNNRSMMISSIDATSVVDSGLDVSIGNTLKNSDSTPKAHDCFDKPINIFSKESEINMSACHKKEEVPKLFMPLLNDSNEPVLASQKLSCNGGIDIQLCISRRAEETDIATNNTYNCSAPQNDSQQGSEGVQSMSLTCSVPPKKPPAHLDPIPRKYDKIHNTGKAKLKKKKLVHPVSGNRTDVVSKDCDVESPSFWTYSPLGEISSVEELENSMTELQLASFTRESNTKHNYERQCSFSSQRALLGSNSSDEFHPNHLDLPSAVDCQKSVADLDVITQSACQLMDPDN